MYCMLIRKYDKMNKRKIVFGKLQMSFLKKLIN